METRDSQDPRLRWDVILQGSPWSLLSQIQIVIAMLMPNPPISSLNNSSMEVSFINPTL